MKRKIRSAFQFAPVVMVLVSLGLVSCGKNIDSDLSTAVKDNSCKTLKARKQWKNWPHHLKCPVKIDEDFFTTYTSVQDGAAELNTIAEGYLKHHTSGPHDERECRRKHRIDIRACLVRLCRRLANGAREEVILAALANFPQIKADLIAGGYFGKCKPEDDPEPDPDLDDGECTPGT